jgi:hypothetical protein
VLESLAPGRPTVLVTASDSAKSRGDFYCAVVIVYDHSEQMSNRGAALGGEMVSAGGVSHWGTPVARFGIDRKPS